MPVNRKSYGRAQLVQVLDDASVKVKLFGYSDSMCRATNMYGEVLIGFDAPEPDSVATRVTQVFLTGEIWGLNKAIVEPLNIEPSRTVQIPWPALAQVSESTLLNYLQFSDKVLNLQPPVIVIAGLAMLSDAVFVREKTEWFTNPVKQGRFLVDTVRCHWTIQDFGVDPAKLLIPWYSAIWDACGLDYSKEPARRSEPQ